MRQLFHTLAAASALPLIVFTSFSHSEQQQAVVGSIGTTGIGIEWILPLNEKLRLRGLLSTLSIDEEDSQDGIDYDIEISGTNLGAVLDWHPFSGGFRLSTGLVRTDFGAELQSSSQDTYDIGNNTYEGSFELEGDVEFASMAPYLSIGWASSLKSKGFYFSGEIGVMVMGDPKISLDASGEATLLDSNGALTGASIDVGTDPNFQSDLERERQELEDDLSDYNLWPIAVVGFGYRF